MKKLYFIMLLLFFFFSFSITAQTMQVQGHLLGDEKQDLESATVRCYTSATIFVAGVTTNMKGLFTLRLPLKEQRYQLRFNYLGYKETILTLYPTKESFVRLGDIRLDKQVEQLQEVTVLGSNEIKMEDKTMYYLTRAQLRHAYNGYNTVEMLMIPGVTANSSSISYFGKNVLLCIDGREATSGEVQNLNPNDIKRIDFYSQSRPDYPEADVIFDYILKERDYAGSVALNANHQLNRLTGNGRGTIQFFEGKSEWTVSVADNYNHFKSHPESVLETTYLFPNEAIVRTDKQLPSSNNNNDLQAYMNYIFKDKKQIFYSSLRMNRKSSDIDNWVSQQYSNNPLLLTKQERRNSTSLNPALQLNYIRDLPRRQKIKLCLYGSHGDNRYDRWYEQREGETAVSAYRNGTDEKSWYGNVDVNYSKTFKNNSALTLAVYQNYTHTDDLNTMQGEVSDHFLKQSNTRLSVLYNYKIKKRFNLQLKVAEEVSYTKTNGNSVTTTAFVPFLKLSYDYKKHSLQLTGTVRSGEPSLSDRTGYEYRMNEYELFVGNPELKNYLRYNGTLRYNWNVSKRWTFIIYSSFEALSNQDYSLHRYDSDRNTFVFQSFNGGSCLWSHSEVVLDYAIIPQKLFFRALGIYDHTNIDVGEKKSYNSFFWPCSIYWRNKGWYVYLGYMSPSKSMSFNGNIYHNSHRLDFNVQYSINNLHISLNVSYPYKAKHKHYITQAEYIQRSISRTPRIDDYIIGLSLNYRFTFGKKKHQFDNSSIKDVNQSTISKE